MRSARGKAFALASPVGRALRPPSAISRLPPAGLSKPSGPRMVSAFMKLFRSALPLAGLILAAAFAGAVPASAADLTGQAQAWTEAHSGLLEQWTKLCTDGYALDANKLLSDQADEDGSAVAAFVVGNALYSYDPAASYRLHLKALRAFPNDPAAVLQAGMELHRHGEYAAAIPHYRRLVAANKLPQSAALLADCLVRTGQSKAAADAWNHAGYPDNHIQINTSICAIYGPLSPHQRRGELIAKIEGGDLAKLPDLILLDLNFDTDWWNAPVNNDALDVDLKRAAAALGKRDARYRHLALYAQLTRTAEKRASEIKRLFKDSNLIVGPGAELPADSRIARAFCELAATARLVTPAELWTTFEPTLRGRLERQDRDALHLLCWLAAAQRNPELTNLDRLGWEEWNDPVFASSYIVDLFREKKLTSPSDSQLLAAMAISPDNSTLTNLRLALAGDNVTTEMIAQSLKAEYRKLSMGDAIRDCSTLATLFAELDHRL